MLARKETVAVFSTVLMDRKKNVVPKTSITAMAPKTNHDFLLRADILLYFLLEKMNIKFQIIPNPNQRVPNCDK